MSTVAVLKLPQACELSIPRTLAVVSRKPVAVAVDADSDQNRRYARAFLSWVHEATKSAMASK